MEFHRDPGGRAPGGAGEDHRKLPGEWREARLSEGETCDGALVTRAAHASTEVLGKGNLGEQRSLLQGIRALTSSWVHIMGKAEVAVDISQVH